MLPTPPRCRSPSSQSGKRRGPGAQPPKPPKKSLPATPGSAAAAPVPRGAGGPSRSGVVVPPAAASPKAAPKLSSEPSHRQGPRTPSAARRPSRCRGLGGAPAAAGGSGGWRGTASLAGGTLCSGAGAALFWRCEAAAGGAAGGGAVEFRLPSTPGFLLPGRPVPASLVHPAAAASAAAASAAAAAAAASPAAPSAPLSGRPSRARPDRAHPGASRCFVPWLPVASPALVRSQRSHRKSLASTQRRSACPTRIPFESKASPVVPLVAAAPGKPVAPAARSPAASVAARPQSHPEPGLELCCRPAAGAGAAEAAARAE